MTDLEKAFDAIRKKRPALDTSMLYAKGPQPLRYSTERLEETFQNINAHFDVNWCSVVINSTLDRLQIKAFFSPEESLNMRLAELFEELHLDIEGDKIHEAALTTSQSYLILWKQTEIEAYFNDPRMCHVFYDPAHPQVKTYAAKWFNQSDGKQQITLYYPERLEHWISEKVSQDSAIDKPSQFTLQTTEPNPYGVIPVFEFKSPGELFQIITLQDAVNKLFADMMVAAEFGAFVQRYVISNSDPGALKNAPNEIWWIPSGDGQGQQSQVGQFAPTQLNSYLEAMDRIAQAIAIITRTPQHYFMSAGSNLSGEALIAMESALTKKVLKRQREFQAQWEDAIQFLLQLDGRSVDDSKLKVIWDRVESTQPKTEAEVAQIWVNLGIPLVTWLRRAGWTEEEIEDLETDIDIQKKAQETLAKATLDTLRIQQQQGNPQDDVVDNAE